MRYYGYTAIIYRETITVAFRADYYEKKIGSTTYEVNACFNPEAKETVEKKILRILKN
ncbi:MAG: transposon-encoded TnpW family protein [Oscillospiraceae bacterium]|nr:transposon-encoded TnpW family protein [Oscillospiraceae bacterium]